jgi:ribonuclease P protein component
VFSEGKSFSIFPLRVFYVSATVQQKSSAVNSAIQFGAGAGSKNFKRAVDRNRIKRLLREAWRLQKLTLMQTLSSKNIQLSVFVIYAGKTVPNYPEVFDAITEVLKKLQSIIHENSAAPA